MISFSCWKASYKAKTGKVSIFLSFVKISLLFIIQVIWLNVITINCALPNYDPMSEAFHRGLTIFNLLPDALIMAWRAMTKCHSRKSYFG